MLHYEQELSMREVGELMGGVGESRVSQIHMAVKHLRQ